MSYIELLLDAWSVCTVDTEPTCHTTTLELLRAGGN